MKTFAMIYNGHFGIHASQLSSDCLTKAKREANKLMRTIKPRPANGMFAISMHDSETEWAGVVFNGVQS